MAAPAAAQPPRLPGVVHARVCTRAHDASELKLELLNVPEARGMRVALRCHDGWRERALELTPDLAIELHGARAEPCRSQPPRPQWQLVLDEACDAHALVAFDQLAHRVELTLDAVTKRKRPAAGTSPSEAPHAPPGSVSQVARLEKSTKYMAPFFAVVLDYSPRMPTYNRSAEPSSTTWLADESCGCWQDGLELKLFHPHSALPHVGAVVRVAGVKVQGQGREECVHGGARMQAVRYACGIKPQPRGEPGTTLTPLFDSGAPGAEPCALGADGALTRLPSGVRLTRAEAERVRELQRWARATLGDEAAAPPFIRGRAYQQPLRSLDWAADRPSRVVDVVARVEWVAPDALGAQPGVRPLAGLRDGTCVRLTPAAAALDTVSLCVNGADEAARARLASVEHMRAQATAAAGNGVELWVRARSVQPVVEGGVPRLLIGRYTSLAVLPEYHADVAVARERFRASAAPPPPPLPPPATAAAASPSAAARGAGAPPPPPPPSALDTLRIPPESVTTHAYTSVAPVRELALLSTAPRAACKWRVQARVHAVEPAQPEALLRASCPERACGAACVRVRGAEWQCTACGECVAASALRLEYQAALVLTDEEALLVVLLTGAEAARLLGAPPAGCSGTSALDPADPVRAVGARLQALLDAELVDCCVYAYNEVEADVTHAPGAAPPSLAHADDDDDDDATTEPEGGAAASPPVRRFHLCDTQLRAAALC